mgnify:FL=1
MSDIGERLDQLESLVEQQQATIAKQRECIADLEREAGRDAPEDTGDPAVVDRRDALKAGGLLALLFGGIGTASAAPQGQLGTADQSVETVYTTALDGPLTGGTELTSLVGDGLTVENGTLTTDGGN